MKSKFPGAVPEIPVRDIKDAAAYYESNLGFTVDWRDEELGLAGIKRKLPDVPGELGLSKGIRQHWASVDLVESGQQRRS